MCRRKKMKTSRKESFATLEKDLEFLRNYHESNFLEEEALKKRNAEDLAKLQRKLNKAVLKLKERNEKIRVEFGARVQREALELRLAQAEERFAILEAVRLIGWST